MSLTPLAKATGGGGSGTGGAGGTGPETDRDFSQPDDFDMSDQLAATIGPVQTVDTLDADDGLQDVVADVRDTMGMSDASRVQLLAPDAPDSLDVGESRVKTSLGRRPDSVDVGDLGFAGESLDVADDVDVSDNPRLVEVSADQPDDFDVSDAPQEISLDADQPDNMDAADELRDLVVGPLPDDTDVSDLLAVDLSASHPDTKDLSDDVPLIDVGTADDLDVSDDSEALLVVSVPDTLDAPDTLKPVVHRAGQTLRTPSRSHLHTLVALSTLQFWTDQDTPDTSRVGIPRCAPNRNAVGGGNERRAYAQYGLRGLDLDQLYSAAASPVSLTVRVSMANNNIVPQTVRWETFWTNEDYSSRPSWNQVGEPTGTPYSGQSGGTSRQANVSVPNTTGQFFTFVDDFGGNLFLAGNESLFVRVTHQGGLTGTEVLVDFFEATISFRNPPIPS